MADVKRVVIYDPTTDTDSSVTSGGAVVVTSDTAVGYTKALAYDASNNLEYLGIAAMGSSKASAVWQIRKFTYDSSNNLTDIQWADGDSDFNNVWNDYASLSYS